MDSMNQIVLKFPEVGEVESIKPLISGLINQTYLVRTADKAAADYILQCINHNIFTDVEMLQHNIEAVTAHVRKKLEAAGEDDIDRKVLRFAKTAEGKTYYFDGEKYWRMCVFIPGSQTLDAVTPESSYLVGLKFGEFEAMLADLPEKLGETIPDFHNMEFRMKLLQPTRQAVWKKLADWLQTLKKMQTKCVVQSACIVKASCRNVSATAIPKLATCCLMTKATYFV